MLKRLLLVLLLVLPSVPAWAIERVIAVSAASGLAATITASGAIASIATGNYPTLSLQLSGTWSGTIQFETSNDNTTFVTLSCAPSNSTTTVTATTSNGLWTCPINGAAWFRLNATAWSSGTATVTGVILASGGGGGSGGGSGTCPKDSGGTDTSDLVNHACKNTLVTAVQLTNIVPKSALTLTTVTIDNAAASGNLSVVAGIANQTINVYGMELFCNGANNWKIVSGTTNTPPTKLPIHNFLANQGIVLDLRADPWVTMRGTATATDNDFLINFSAAQQCSGIAYYTQG